MVLQESTKEVTAEDKIFRVHLFDIISAFSVTCLGNEVGTGEYVYILNF